MENNQNRMCSVAMETNQNRMCSKEVEYPPSCRSNKNKKKHKEETLLAHPEELYADYTVYKDKMVMNDLIFHTEHVNSWKQVICNHYDHVVKEGIGRGGRHTICHDETLDTDNPVLTISYYVKGTVLVQGNEANLNIFQELFPKIKTEVERVVPNTNKAADTQTEEDKVNTDTEISESKPATSPSDCATPTPSNHTVNPVMPLPAQRAPVSPSIHTPSTPSKLVQQLRESVSLLELEFTEFKERTLARLTEPCTIQQLGEELRHLKRNGEETASELRETQRTVMELTETMRELEQDNNTLQARMKAMKEDTNSREESLRSEIEEVKLQRQEERIHTFPPDQKQSSAPTLTTPPPPTAKPEYTPPPLTPLTPPSLTPNDIPLDSDPLPAAQPPPEPRPQSTRPAQPEAQVVLLMDSNGKYLDTARLFPGLKVTAKRCRNTGHAMELLRQDTLGSPQYMVVHTGTNDLHYLQRGTAEAMTRVAEKASREFPHTRVIISTLLPRMDTPPYIIHEINMETSRNCAALKNVHLAHHTNIGRWDFNNDGLHLNNAGVRTFAKTLKDAALGRNPNRPSHTPASPRKHRPMRYPRGVTPQTYAPPIPHLSTPPSERRHSPSRPLNRPQQQITYAPAPPTPHPSNPPSERRRPPSRPLTVRHRR